MSTRDAALAAGGDGVPSGRPPGPAKPWVGAIAGRHPVQPADGAPVRVGVLRGEGVGPEVIGAATEVLAASCERGGRALEVDFGPDAERSPARGKLTEAAAGFCRDTFARGGAVLTGPHGGRWVYELRQRFDLFCKISPLRPATAIAPADGPVWPGGLSGVDVLTVREQAAGIYQGRWAESDAPREGHVAEHSFSYSARTVRRILEVAAALSAAREGRLAVVVKRDGVPAISRLWIQLAEEVAGARALESEVLDIDYAVYRLLRDPARLDVVVAPNLFGDVLADAGAVLLGSRGLSYGASFDDARAAVYQTNHGSAHDLAGGDRANPVAQILAAAAMLRESFALGREAAEIEAAVDAVWRAGWRTDDLTEAGCTCVGTRELGARVAEAVAAGSLPEPADAPSSSGRRAGAAAAVRVTARAGERWRSAAPDRRSEVLERAADLLEARSALVADLIAGEVGKPIHYGRLEAGRGVALLRAAARLPIPEPVRTAEAEVRRVPLGVVAQITPWNNPLAVPLGKLSPALRLGNSVVWKPSPLAPLVAGELIDLLVRAGLPADLVTLLHGGAEAAVELIGAEGIGAVSLTGSSGAGDAAQRICAERRIPLQAELGGNNASIVWRDSDLAAAATAVAEAGFGCAGQRCTANRRVVVDAACFDRFLAELEAATRELELGEPTDPAVRVGPLISEAARERVAALVERAGAAAEVRRPAVDRDRLGGLASPGRYLEPALIVDPDPSSEIVQTETFGPVVVLQRAEGFEQAMALVNGVGEGLVAALFSGSEDLRRHFLAGARAGVLKLNRATADVGVEAPFGGWGRSGVGPPEHGDGNREFYTRPQAIYS